MYKKIILAALCLIVHETECMILKKDHIKRPLPRAAEFQPSTMSEKTITRQNEDKKKLHKARAVRKARRKALQELNKSRLPHQNSSFKSDETYQNSSAEFDESDDYFNRHDDHAYIDRNQPCLTKHEIQWLFVIATASFAMAPFVSSATDYSIRNLALLMQHMNSN